MCASKLIMKGIVCLPVEKEFCKVYENFDHNEVKLVFRCVELLQSDDYLL